MASKLDEILSRFRMNKDSLQQPCSQEHANNIGRKITSWRAVAPFLGLSEVDEKDIIEDSRPGRERSCEMMRKWLHVKGQSATYLELAEAFLQVQQRDLVEKLCEIIQESEGSEPRGSETRVSDSDQQRPVMISDKPSLSKLQKFVGRSGKTYKILAKVFEWERLAIALKLDEHIGTVRRNTFYQVDKACLEILAKWLDGGGRKPVTWSTFIECLGDIDLHTLAEELRTEFAV